MNNDLAMKVLLSCIAPANVQDDTRTFIIETSDYTFTITARHNRPFDYEVTNIEATPACGDFPCGEAYQEAFDNTVIAVTNL